MNADNGERIVARISNLSHAMKCVQVPKGTDVNDLHKHIEIYARKLSNT